MNNSNQQTALSHDTGRIEVISRSTLLGKEIDVYGSAENPLFRAKEVAEWIEHSDVNMMLKVVDDEEKLTQALFVSGQRREVWFLTEDGLYEVLMQSRKPIAKQFKKGIKEILKSIRKTGSYSVQQQHKIPQSFSEALMLAAEQAKRIEEQQLQIEQKEQQIREDAPRVLFSKAVETAKRSCLIAELAKILQQNGIQIGQNRLFAWLRENGYLGRKGQYYNQPTQKAMELGLFELKQTTINKPDGSVLVTTTTKVTGKGQIYFVDKFLGKERA